MALPKVFKEYYTNSLYLLPTKGDAIKNILNISDEEAKKIKIKILNKHRLIKNYDKIRKENREYCKEHYRKNRSEIIQKGERYLKCWVNSGIIPEKANCQNPNCNKELFFRHKNKDLVFRFDHRHGKTLMKPKHWLCCHLPTDENIKKWKSEDFGILCAKCNTFLPTENREKILEGFVKYVFNV